MMRSRTNSVQVVMEPIPAPRPEADVADPDAGVSAAALPLRWVSAVNNLESAQATVAKLTEQLEGCMYLGEEEWRQAAPVHKFRQTLQVWTHWVCHGVCIMRAVEVGGSSSAVDVGFTPTIHLCCHLRTA